MTPVIGCVDNAVAASGAYDVMQVLVLAFDLAKDGIQRMLQRAIQPMPLRGAQLLEIRKNPLSRLFAALTAAAQVLYDLFAGQYSLSDFVKHGEPDYTTAGGGPAQIARHISCGKCDVRERPARSPAR